MGKWEEMEGRLIERGMEGGRGNWGEGWKLW